MKVTGVKIKEMIRIHELRRDAVVRQYEPALHAFKDEKKTHPKEIVAKYLDAERSIARLQTAQARYNLKIEVDVVGEKMTLAEAIKRVGGAGRAEKLWRTATGPKQDRYAYRGDDLVREEGKERAIPTVTPDQALEFATEAARVAGAFRAAIATGNAREIEIEDLDAALFE